MMLCIWKGHESECLRIDTYSRFLLIKKILENVSNFIIDTACILHELVNNFRFIPQRLAKVLQENEYARFQATLKRIKLRNSQFL